MSSSHYIRRQQQTANGIDYTCAGRSDENKQGWRKAHSVLHATSVDCEEEEKSISYTHATKKKNTPSWGPQLSRGGRPTIDRLCDKYDGHSLGLKLVYRYKEECVCVCVCELERARETSLPSYAHAVASCIDRIARSIMHAAWWRMTTTLNYIYFAQNPRGARVQEKNN